MPENETSLVREAAKKYEVSQEPDREWLDELEELVLQAEEELGIRLEVVDGMPIWEAHPRYRHQSEIDRIRESIHVNPAKAGSCECIHVSDLTIRFPDGSIKTPDISVFCRKPAEQDKAVRVLPEAVIEVLSKRSKRKDLEFGVPFYLREGVKDVIVLNPDTGNVAHHRHDRVRESSSPVAVEFECGCVCTV